MRVVFSDFFCNCVWNYHGSIDFNWPIADKWINFFYLALPGKLLRESDHRG
jgi:hypothetical protein